MEGEKSNRTTLIAVITGIVALLLGLCLGGLVGGASGYLIGRSAAPRVAPAQLLPRVNPTPQRRLPVVPTPAAPQTPERMRPGGLMPQAGAMIQEVVAGSPAAEAGLKAGDIITMVDKTPIDADHRLADVVTQYKPGDKVSLTVWRMGNTRTITVTVGAHPDDAQRAYLGVRYGELTPQRGTPQPGE
jgi:S1-C subfamily serine protease